MGGVIVLDYEYISRYNFKKLSNLFNPNYLVDSEDREIVNNYSKGIVYVLLCLGVPKKQLQIILQNAFNYCTSQEIKREFEKKKRKLKENGKCAVCGSTNNLTVHHLKPTGRGYGYLKYNPGNWIVLCRECHEDLHNRLGV